MINLEELNYPIPDPAWDYATIYHRCHHARQELEKLLAYMSQFEEATGESDRCIRDQLDQIGQHLNQTRRMID